MRRTYVTPKVTCETFAPNEYIAACAENIFSNGGGLLVCDGSSHDKANPHGFILGPEDMRYIDAEGSLGIYSCPFVYKAGKKKGEHCAEYEPGDAHDLDLSADDIAKEENYLADFTWYDLSFRTTDKRGDPIYNVGAQLNIQFDTYTAAS